MVGCEWRVRCAACGGSGGGGGSVGGRGGNKLLSRLIIILCVDGYVGAERVTWKIGKGARKL